jgi:hypothetical protein
MSVSNGEIAPLPKDGTPPEIDTGRIWSGTGFLVLGQLPQGVATTMNDDVFDWMPIQDSYVGIALIVRFGVAGNDRLAPSSCNDRRRCGRGRHGLLLKSSPGIPPNGLAKGPCFSAPSSFADLYPSQYHSRIIAGPRS